MTIFVDPLMGHGLKLRGHTVHNCHLFSDTDVDELHAFAERIGMDRTWFPISASRTTTSHHRAGAWRCLAVPSKSICAKPSTCGRDPGSPSPTGNLKIRPGSGSPASPPGLVLQVFIRREGISTRLDNRPLIHSEQQYITHCLDCRCVL